MKLNKFSGKEKNDKERNHQEKNALNRRINKLAIPILFSYLSHFLFSIGDQAIIGRTSLTEYAAVSVVANLLFAITGTLGVITLALNIIGSKKLGEQDYEGYSDLFSTVMTIVLIIGATFEIVCLTLGRPILMYGFNMSGNLLDYGYGYLSVAGIGLGLNLILFIFSSYFKSVERTKIILVATLSSCAINLCIDYVLVFGKMGFPKMGVIGAAIGTVIGLLINVVIYIIGFGCYSKFKYRFWVKLSYMKPVLKSYIPLLGQDFIESTAFAIVLTMIIARLGSESIGTYGLVNILLQAVVLPIYAYCSASMTITSKAYGASDFHVMKQVPSLIIRNLIIMIGILGVLIFGFADQVPRLITNDMTIISFVSKVMGIALLSQAFNMANQVYRYGLNALNDEKWVLYYSSVVSFVSLVVIYAFAVPLRLGLKGVFVGLGINYLMHSIGFYGRYKRKTETIAGVSIAECNRIVN